MSKQNSVQCTEACVLGGVIRHHLKLFLWGYIIGSAYGNNPHNIDELKTNISNTTADISPIALQAVSMDMFHHAGYVCNMLLHPSRTFCDKMYYKHLTVNKVLVLKNHHTAHTSLARMVLAL
jgi:hypothetical protein